MRAAWLLVLWVGCAAHGKAQLPESPTPTGPPLREVARAVIELPAPDRAAEAVERLPPELERLFAGARPPRTIDVGDWPALFRSQRVRAAAEAQVGSRIDESEVRVWRDGRRLTVEVSGAGRDAAVARCLALLRAAEQTGRSDAGEGLRFLRDQRRLLRRELAIKRALLRDPDPASAFASAEQAREHLRRSLATLDDPKASPERLLFPTLGAADSEREAAAVELYQLSSARGPMHPEVALARARLQASAQRVESQRAVERAWASALLADLDEAPPTQKEDRLPRARTVALAAALRGASDCVIPSAAPLGLQALALDCQEAALERDRAAFRVPVEDPRLVALRARLQAAQRAFDGERRARLALLDQDLAGFASPTPTGRERELRLRAALDRQNVERLVDNLERLSSLLSDRIDREEEQREEARLPRVERCAVQR